MKKSAVVCANGKAEQLIVKEAVNRGFDAIAMVDESESSDHIQQRISVIKE